MQKKDENEIIINCWWDLCLDNKYKTKYYEDNLTFFDKIAEHISDLLWIDFFIPYSSYNKVKNNSYRNPNYLFLENKNPENVFDNIKDILDIWDINCFNLESPISEEDPYYDVIWIDPTKVDILKKWNINYVNIANNHMFDLWVKGFRDTIENLKKGWINYFWWWPNSIESHKPIIFEKNWTKIWFLWYFQNTRTNINYVCSAEWKSWINPICEEEIFKDISKAKQDFWVDLLFVSLHGDIENHIRVSKQFEKLCKKIIGHWADWIFWHHSHVPKKIDIYMGKPIFYSFWNFIFGQYYKKFWKDNYFAQIKIQNKKIVQIYKYIITWDEKNIFQPSIIKTENLI